MVHQRGPPVSRSPLHDPHLRGLWHPKVPLKRHRYSLPLLLRYSGQSDCHPPLRQKEEKVRRYSHRPDAYPTHRSDNICDPAASRSSRRISHSQDYKLRLPVPIPSHST